jgi:hypothetical protein
MPEEMIRELDELRARIAQESGPLRTVRDRIAREAGPDVLLPPQLSHGSSRAAAARALLAYGMAMFKGAPAPVPRRRRKPRESEPAAG